MGNCAAMEWSARTSCLKSWVAVKELTLVTIIQKPYYLLYIRIVVTLFSFLSSNPEKPPPARGTCTAAAASTAAARGPRLLSIPRSNAQGAQYSLTKEYAANDAEESSYRNF